MKAAVLPAAYEVYPGGGVGTAVLPTVYEICPGDGMETAVLWQHGFRNERIGNGPQLTKIIQVVDGNGRFARSLRKLSRWWMETAVLPIVRKIYPGGGWVTAVLWQHGFRNERIGNGRSAPQLMKIIQVMGGNGRSAHSSKVFQVVGEAAV
ncbi:MAG: hypothetical protein M5U34_18290 [Chloroflexi bacterium]|nr:hypothetical protein [Chloroflexota bacterium]